MKKKLLYSLCATLILLFGACSQTQTENELPTITNTPTVTVTIAPTVTPTVELTLTPTEILADMVVIEGLTPNMIQAYRDVIELYQEEMVTVLYDFVYVTNDDAPELLVDGKGYWFSLYTYVEDTLYPICEYEPYGLWGRKYFYKEKADSIYLTSYMLSEEECGEDVQVLFDDFFRINENYELEFTYSLATYVYGPDEKTYYLDEELITKEQYEQYIEEASVEENYIALEGMYAPETIIQKMIAR